MRLSVVATAICLSIVGLSVASESQAVITRYELDIRRQSLDAALKEFAQQTGLQIARFSDTIDGSAIVGPLTGQLSAEDALESLLTPSGLTYKMVNDRTIAVVPLSSREEREGPAKLEREGLQRVPAAGGVTSGQASSGFWDRFRLAQNAQPSKKADSGVQEDNQGEYEGQELPAPEETRKAVPEILIKGSRSLNVDIRRSRDDAQPYVIFERATLEQSGAVNVEEFLKKRLPMNTSSTSRSQIPDVSGNGSAIGLRGLGANQTLILVDGRRLQSVSLGGFINQGDLNGIPLAAIERIEVLPTTASGIYGGGATGGAINIIMRRDYAGIEAKVTYENAFDGAQASRRIDLSTGFTLEGGRTSVLLAGTYSDTDPLLAGERDFIQRGELRILANNPGFLLPITAPFPDPPLGATTNIRSATVTGGVLQNLTLKNGTALGSTFTSVPAGYAGPAADGGAGLRVNAGQYNLNLANTAQGMTNIGLGRGGSKVALLNGPTVESAMATVRREFSPGVQAFLELSASNNIGRAPANRTGSSQSFTLPSTSANNPFNQDIRVTVPIGASDSPWESRSDDRRLAGGVIIKLPATWQGEMDYTWGRSSFKTKDQIQFNDAALTAAIRGDSARNVLRDTEAFPVDYAPFIPPLLPVTPFRSTLKDATLRLAGPVLSLPAGVPRVSILLEHREEDLAQALAGGLVRPSRSQTVVSAYLETLLPLVSARNEIPGVQDLDLQLAGRFDEYEVRGAPAFFAVGSTAPIARSTKKVRSVDPTVGLRYQPVQDLMLRTSYGTGFLPPSVNQFVPPQVFNITLANADPRRGNTPVGAVQTVFFGNPDLDAEESRSWSAGAVFTPRIAPGLRLSLDYTRIEKRGNIVILTAAQLLANESAFASRIVRDPRLRQPTDPSSWADPIARLDQTSINIARTDLEAYDLQLDYQRETASAGTFDFFVLGTRQTHFKTQLLPSLPIVENVGVTSSNPLKLKANAGVSWKYGPWTLGWVARHFDSYLLTNATQVLNQGSGGVIPSQTYHDAFATWSAPADLDSGLFSNVEVQLGVKNVFDKEPPFDAGNSRNSFFYSTYGDPRLTSYQLSLKKSF